MKIFDPKRINYDLFLLTVFVVTAGSLVGIFGYLNRPEKVIEVDLREEVKGTLTELENDRTTTSTVTTVLPSLERKKIQPW